MKSKKVPQIHSLKEGGYKLDISIKMIMISVSLTTRKTNGHQIYALYSPFLFQSHGGFYRTESISGTWYHGAKTHMEHAEPSISLRVPEEWQLNSSRKSNQRHKGEYQ